MKKYIGPGLGGSWVRELPSFVELGCAILLEWMCSSQPGSSLNPVLLGIFMEASSLTQYRSLTPSSALLPSQEDRGWGWRLQSSNHGLVSGDWSLSRLHPAIHALSPHWNKKHSCHPGNYKGFRNSVRNRDQRPIGEQEMITRDSGALCWELRAGPIHIFSSISQYGIENIISSFTDAKTYLSLIPILLRG